MYLFFLMKTTKECDALRLKLYYQGEKQKRKDVNPLEDSKIIELFFARDEAAIRQTDAVYGKRLHRLAYKILSNQENAEESVSDTYMEVWETIPPQHPNYFYAFIASICRHLSFHKLDWKLAAKRNAEVVSLTEEMEQCIPDVCRDRELEDREIGRVMDAFLESLPQETRLIFLRRYWHADTITEIAARYAITESKVKMQLSRTRTKLQYYLRQEGIQV